MRNPDRPPDDPDLLRNDEEATNWPSEIHLPVTQPTERPRLALQHWPQELADVIVATSRLCGPSEHVAALTLLGAESLLWVSAATCSEGPQRRLVATIVSASSCGQQLRSSLALSVGWVTGR